MDIRQIRYVLVLARHQQFTKAAAELSITQPALSTQISLTEEELGLKLFNRTTRAVTLTPAGEVFCEKANELMRVWEDVITALEEQRAKAMTPIKIGMPLRSAHTSPAFTACMDFFEGRSDYEVSYISETDSKLLSMTYTGEIDATLCTLPLQGDITKVADELITVPLNAEPNCAVMNKDHFLAHRESMSLSDLEGCTLITGPVDSPGALLLDSMTKELELEPFDIIHTNGMDMTVRLVRRDEGIAFAPKSVADYYGLATVPVTSFALRPLGLVYRSKNPDPILIELRDHLTAAL